MRVDRLRATHHCRVLTQSLRWLLGAYRVFFSSVLRFSTLRPVRRIALLFTGRYVSPGEVRFRTPPGCECDLLLVLGLEKPTFATPDSWLPRRARARLLSRCGFVPIPCWACRQFYFLCFAPLSSNSGTSASRAARGFGALSA